MLHAMRWSWVGLVAVVLACAGTRPELETPGPAKDVTWVFRVVDPEGQPVSGARVNVWRADQSPAYGQPGSTDAQGTGRVALKPGWYGTEVQARGFVTAFREDIRIAPDSKPRMELSLARSAPLVGRVVDAEGKPVSGVRIRFASSNAAAPFVEAISGEAGQFSMQGAAAGEGFLYSDKDGWSWQRLKVITPQPELTVVMGQLSSLLVRGLDLEGRLIPNSHSSITPLDRPIGIRHQSEQTPEGTIHQLLPAQRYRVIASYAPAPRCWWRRAVDVEVLPGQQAEVTVSFEGATSAGPWTGRAVTPDGWPLANMKLRATAPPSAEGMEVEEGCEGTTGPDGRFELSHPQAGLHRLQLRHAAEPHERVGEAELAPSNAKDEPVVFHAPGTLVGRVLGPDGKPMTYFDVDWQSQSDRDGRFIRGPTRSRTYSLRVDAAYMASSRVRVEARAHEERRVPDIQLDTGHSVLGRLLEADGRTPVTKVWIELVDPADVDIKLWNSRFGARPDEAGRFRLDHVPRRPQYLRLNRLEGGTLLYELGARESRVELRLKPDATLEGFVTDGTRVPLAGVMLEVRCGAGLDASTKTDDAGHYVLRVPADRDCFVHFPVDRRWIYTWPRPTPPVFSPQPVSLSPRERERRDFVSRSGGARLQVHFPKVRDGLETFLVPGNARMPKTFADLKALQRSAFISDPALNPWRTDDPDMPVYAYWQKDFSFSHLPDKRYTLFAVEPQDGATAVLRVPVDLKPGETQSFQPGFPIESGGTFLVP
ncbi:carboxypeptidase regulatory-like domain-containing protein [Corallococcus sp. AB030]|nr:carboxypeptidase regulatory-like domain-containing protein [Corallococcus sp. CA041A]RKI10449.1 carboxypeptidase regulatory-like domain-containing protein [Corallococcus sp. AB030]